MIYALCEAVVLHGLVLRFLRFHFLAGHSVLPGGIRPYVLFHPEKAIFGDRLGLGLDVAASQATLLQILLVIVLGLVERLGRNDLRHNRLAEAARSFQRLFRGLGLGFLLRRVKEDRRAVLRSPVGALAVELRRIVILPESLPAACRRKSSRDRSPLPRLRRARSRRYKRLCKLDLSVFPPM